MQQTMVNQSKSLACAFFHFGNCIREESAFAEWCNSERYSSLQPVNITAGTGKEHLGASYVYEKAWIQTKPVHHGPRHAHSPWAAYASADVMPNIGGSIPQRTHRPIKRSKSYHLNISHWIGECFGMFLIPESVCVYVCVWIHSSTPMQAYSPTCHAIATTKIAMYSGTVVAVKDFKWQHQHRSMQLKGLSDKRTIQGWLRVSMGLSIPIVRQSSINSFTERRGHNNGSSDSFRQ